MQPYHFRRYVCAPHPTTPGAAVCLVCAREFVGKPGRWGRPSRGPSSMALLSHVQSHVRKGDVVEYGTGPGRYWRAAVPAAPAVAPEAAPDA